MGGAYKVILLHSLKNSIAGWHMKDTEKFKIPKSFYLLVACAVVMFLLYFAIVLFKPQTPEVVSFPASNLTASIFDAQNMKYRKVTGMDTKVVLSDTAYTVDAPPGEKAVVDGAQIVLYEGYYFFYDVRDEGTSMDNRLRATLSSVLSMNSDPLACEVTCLASETGYINGCQGYFYLYKVAAEEAEQYIALYDLEVYGGRGLPSGKHIVVGTMGSGYSTSTFKTLQGVSESLVYTLRLDEKLADELELRLQGE